MNKFYNHKIIINKEQNLLRLDQALTNLSNFTRSQMKILILNGNISIGEKIYNEASYKVKEGQEFNLKVNIPKKEKFEAEDISLDIIYEDRDIIILNKKAGMVVHPAPGNYTGTLVNALINYTNNNLSNLNISRPGIIHRLDKETSGLLVVAKNNESHLILSEQFKNHNISRKYKAIVWGVPQKQTIEGYIERNKINRKKMSLTKNPRGKYSKTKISLLHSYEIASLVECSLETGRTHQVRLHMTSINSPLVGDKIYGKNKKNQFSKYKDNFNKFLILKNFSRQALHAYHLGFEHPKSKKYVEFNSELPKDMKDLLNFIVKY